MYSGKKVDVLKVQIKKEKRIVSNKLKYFIIKDKQKFLKTWNFYWSTQLEMTLLPFANVPMIAWFAYGFEWVYKRVSSRKHSVGGVLPVCFLLVEHVFFKCAFFYLNHEIISKNEIYAKLNYQNLFIAHRKILVPNTRQKLNRKFFCLLYKCTLIRS